MSYMLKRRVPLTKTYLLGRLRYHPELGGFTHRPRPVITAKDQTWNTRYAGTVAGWRRDKNSKYVLITIDNSKYYAHHLVWLVETGVWPVEQIDHKDGDPSNNRFSNLRTSTQSQNCMNAAIPRHNTTGVKGVHYATHYGCYVAKIEKDGRVYHIGYFDTVEAGAKARAAAEERMFGEFHHRKHRKAS